jgi:hypothetical protein
MECEAPGEPDAAEEQVEEVIQQAWRSRGDVWERHTDRGAWGLFRWRWRGLRVGAAEPRAEARQGAVVGGVAPKEEAREWTFGIHRWAWARRACTDGYGERSGNHAGGRGEFPVACAVPRLGRRWRTMRGCSLLPGPWKKLAGVGEVTQHLSLSLL